MDGQMTQVFLKQFRDSADGSLACYQSVVEAPVNVTKAKPRPSTRDWQVTIHPIDSHPIARDLGVRSQVAGSSVDMELEFILGTGQVVAPAAAHAPVAPGSPGLGASPAEPVAPEMTNGAGRANGLGIPLTTEVFALVEATAGRVYRHLSVLRRFRPW